MELFISLLVLLGVGVVYFLPSIAAKSNKHKNSDAIMIVNFFFGWTIIGWVGCLAWAYCR